LGITAGGGYEFVLADQMGGAEVVTDGHVSR
jgi:hypothetical protein